MRLTRLGDVTGLGPQRRFIPLLTRKYDSRIDISRRLVETTYELRGNIRALDRELGIDNR